MSTEPPKKPWLTSVGHYISPLGGAKTSVEIRDNLILVELITAGCVFDPDEVTERNSGWVFIHQPGQQTIWRSPPDQRYECLTLNFDYDLCPQDGEWPRGFSWGNPQSATLFAQEMLYAFHSNGVDPLIQSQAVWSQLRFRLDQYIRSEKPTNTHHVLPK